MFIAMEFVDGVTLSAWLAEKMRSWQEIADAFVRAGRGLAAAHRAGIVHRDFKPQNVMMGADGGVRVTDFGLARRFGSDECASEHSRGESPSDQSLTQTGEQLGTPLYMAPEQVSGAAVDSRSDQFSFCVSLYWALWGTHPFDATVPERLAAAGNVGSRFVPSWLRRVLDRGLSTNPSARWGSMDDLLAALGRDPARRVRIISGLVAILVVCAMVGFATARITGAARTVCDGGEARIAGIWEIGPAGQKAGSRRQALHASVMAEAGQDGAMIWDLLSAALDLRVSAWLSAYRQSCEASNVKNEQSAELTELRTACLDETLNETLALTDLVAQGNPSVIAHAAEGVGSLEAVELCSNEVQLRAGLRLPKDPVPRARITAIRKSMLEARLRFGAGERQGAWDVAALAEKEATEMNYCPLEAEALLAKANVTIATFSPAAIGQMAATLRKALVVAQRCGHDRLVAEAATQLVLADSARSGAYEELAEATIGRIGGDLRLEGWLANNRGAVLYLQGHVQDAIKQCNRAIALKAARIGVDPFDVAISQRNLALALRQVRRFDEALAIAKRAESTSLKWSRSSPMLAAQDCETTGDILVDLGRFDEAEEEYQRALAILAASPNHDQNVIDVLRGGLGRVFLERGDGRAALPYLEAALKASLPDERAEFQYLVARALGPKNPRARVLARKAKAYFEVRPDMRWRAREINVWTRRTNERTVKRVLVI
jgi:tetratricopeptide (TPR) repeat protein